jgi:cobalt-zinc-cadmium resistance protein CzcA
MIVYLPILTLEGIEGKLFRPMALTVIFALAGSMVLSMTLMPVLASFLPRRIDTREPLLMRLIKWLYGPILRLTMEHKLVVIGITVGVLVVAFGTIAPHLGSEFVPQLSEGAVVIGITRPSGTDLDECVRYNTRMEQAIQNTFPDEVRHIWSRVGTAEVATDPMGVEETDLFISLKARSSWTRAASQDELVERIVKLVRDLPGQKLAFSQPIEQRIDEMISGVRSDVAVKLFGDDLEILKTRARDIERVLRTIPGNADVKTQQITGQPVLQVRIDQDQIARQGVHARAVLDLVESIGSKPLGEVIEGQLHFPLAVRLPEDFRRSPKEIGAMLVSTPSGQSLPLYRLATVQVIEGPSTIDREWGQRRITITANVRGRDMGGFVAEAQQKVKEQVLLPPGRYHITWGGQFERYQSARTRLLVIVPLAVVLIFGLLYLSYQNAVDALRVCTGVPLGWVGGIVALWLRGMPFSISAAVGFVALSGVAVLNDMILVSCIRQLRRQGMERDEAVRQAALLRLRPVLMTTLVASLGFLPMAFSTGMGAEVQRPLATVVIGGVISAMLMSLLVIRVLYVLFDSLAHGAQWLLIRLFGFRPEQMFWLFGGHGEGASDLLATASGTGPADRSSRNPERAHV